MSTSVPGALFFEPSHTHVFYNADTFVSPQPGLCLLEIYAPSDWVFSEGTSFPSCFKIVREVTNEKEYSMRNIAM